MHEHREDRGPNDRRSSARPRAAAAPAGVLGLQRAAGNRAVTERLAALPSSGTGTPVQRVKDAFDVTLDKPKLTLAQAFQDKHVGADAEGAKAATHARFLAGKMPKPMEEGRMSNTVATSSTWVDAVHASETKVNTENKAWTNDVALKVNGWQVRWNPSTEDYDATAVSDVTLKAGGYAWVTYKGTRGAAAKQVTGGGFTVDHIGNG